MKEKKKLSVRACIALAVLIETLLSLMFTELLDHFVNLFYADYTHLTVWGDIAAIGAVVISFIIYDSFAHKAYKEIKSRLMFLGTVYVASKAASIVHYLTAILVNLLTVNSGDTVQSVISVLLAVFEIAVDIAAAVWLIGYFERKINNQKT